MNKYRVKITDSKSNTFEKVYHINNSGTKPRDPNDFQQIEEYLINNKEFLQDIIDSDILYPCQYERFKNSAKACKYLFLEFSTFKFSSIIILSSFNLEESIA